MTREWWYPGGIGRTLKQPLTRWFFGQLARTYGFVRLPPVVGKDEFRGQGALGIRHALALTRGNAPQLIGIAPEGRTGEKLSLCEPPAGAGLFLLMLTHDVIPCLPVGIYEDAGGALTADFGAPFQLNAPRAGSRDEHDREAARHVMVEIGKLLPERMWGVYGADIQKCSRRNGGNP
jgi:1-acyl-sn-glycerol-3-phosphate acyltransferase